MSAVICRASAPGSIMITGEHAVVYGHAAIVAAVSQRVEVTIETRHERWVAIHSEIAPPVRQPLDALVPEGAMRFVLHAVQLYQARLSGGLLITIRTGIDPTLGLGSSAAVTIATLGALAQLTGQATEGLHTQALGIIRKVQGRGSGADLAASLRGGMSAYQLSPAMLTGVPDESLNATIAPLPAPPLMSLRYVGYKTPTAEVLARIAAQMQGREAEFDALYRDMGVLSAETIAAARARDWTQFGAALQAYQALMVRLGVSDAALDAIVAEALKNPGVLAAKISGSGLGDCVLALGQTPAEFTLATLDEKGLILHD